MLIFDRWGAVLFEGRNLPIGDLSSGWDGTYNGSVVDPGVYVYLIEVEFIDNRVFLYRGDITLVR